MKINAIANTAFSLILFCTSLHVHGHVRWDPNGILQARDEGFYSCDLPAGERTMLASGATITVSYEVAIIHGQAMRIDIFYGDGSSALIKDAIPEVPGFSSTSITLPDTECDECYLRIYGSGYVSCAEVRLSETGEPEPDPMDTQAPANVDTINANPMDTQIVLNWSNPSEDFLGVLVLQSQTSPDTAPMGGTPYQLNDAIGNAIVAYKGSAESTTISALTADTNYYFKIHSYDASLNYASGAEVQATTTNVGNSQPVVSLNVLQGTDLTTEIQSDGGIVIVQAIINDPDSNDTHSIDWSASDMRLTDVDLMESTFTFDPTTLAAGNYTIVVEVSDNGTPQFMDTAEIVVSVTVPAAEPPANPPPSGSNNAGGSGGGSLYPLSVIFLVLYACASTSSCKRKRQRLYQLITRVFHRFA